MLLGVLPVIAGLALTSTSADHLIFITACEAAIKDRIAVPETYRRRNVTVTDHFLTRDEYLALLKERGVKEMKPLAEFDRGTLQPRNVGILVDYEAADENATLVSKRSFCKIQIFRPSSGFNPRSLQLDGRTEFGGEWIPVKRPSK